MQHSVIMPFSRPKYFQTLREGMEGQGVTWVPLYDSDECHELFTDKGVLGKHEHPWIRPWRGDLPCVWTMDDGGKRIKGPPTVNPGHWMCDAFLDERVKQDKDKENRPDTYDDAKPFFRPDHYVSFMTDDCYWSWNYWRKLQRHFVKRGPKDQEYGPAVIMSATRLGGNIIYAQHRNERQRFHESTCTTFTTRFEALTVRADLLREPRFGSFWAADGIMVERLVESNIGLMPESVAFANECVVYFNALKPEAWGFPASHQP